MSRVADVRQSRRAPRWRAPAAPSRSTTSWARARASTIAVQQSRGRAPVPRPRGARCRQSRRPPARRRRSASCGRCRCFRSTGAKSCAVREQRLRLAQEQAAVVDQREMEAARRIAGLRLGVEVHQQVAADEQVDPRDRRVLHQVVPAEDDGASQIAVDRRSGRPVALEVLLAAAPAARPPMLARR